MEDNKNLILDIKDLVIHYETDDGVVEAVNGIDIQLDQEAVGHGIPICGAVVWAPPRLHLGEHLP